MATLPPPSPQAAQKPSAWHHPDQLINCLRLARTERIGPTTFKLLMRSFATPAAAIEALPEFYKKGFLKPLTIVSIEHIEKEMARTSALCGQYLVLGGPDYPLLLSHIPNPPPVLSYIGHLNLVQRPCLAIVGARNASAAALTLGHQISQGVGQHGVVCVSGLARGIDTQAHKAALESGTIAVIANGMDIAYPPENKKLQEDIQAAGLLICEHPPATVPHAYQFPRRNRIIAGLSVATLVIEAARRSGSLITARLAADFGRSVMAVPGSPLDPRCHGSNHLLRDGAILVESTDDVIEAVASDFRHFSFDSPPLPTVAPDANQNVGSLDLDELSRLRQLLGPTPVDIDTLARLADIPLARISLYLVLLDLDGHLVHTLDGRVSALDPAP